MQEMAHIANGRDPGNCVSLLKVNVSFELFLLKFMKAYCCVRGCYSFQTINCTMYMQDIVHSLMGVMDLNIH